MAGKEKNKGGRPTRLSRKLAKTVCDSLASGKSLRETCKPKNMPHRHTVINWLLKEENAWFFDQYTRARATQADILFDEIEEIAKEVENKNDPSMVDVNIARLRIDTRKWSLARTKPKKYGDRIQQEITGKDGEPLVTNVIVYLPDNKRAKGADGNR